MISFDEFVKKSEELKKYKNSILKLIDEFILLNIDEFINLTRAFESFEKTYDFYTDKQLDNMFIICFYYNGYRTYNVKISREIYLKLEEFIKNPSIYRNVNKYNI